MTAGFEQLKFDEKTPVYLQIISYIKAQILLGNLKNGDDLPSRRMLATVLNVNPNTVQKTYKQLEDEGIITTPANANSIISVNKETMAKIKQELTEARVNEFLKAAKEIKLSFKEVIALISDSWDKV